MEPLHMLSLPLRPERLMANARLQGLVGDGFAADDGYLVHAGLAALFGKEAAPSPFALMPAKGRSWRLLAYSTRPLSSLEEAARLHAEPEAFEIVDWAEAAGKPMPASFVEGQRLAFRVTALPTVRMARGVTGVDPGSEQDAYVAWLRTKGFPPARERDPSDRPSVYVDWLRRQLEKDGAVVLEVCRIDSLRGVRLWRRGLPKRAGAAKRGLGGLERARVELVDRTKGRGAVLDRRSVTFAGSMRVGEPEAFRAMLARGIGRHRAFGYGMLLLRRPDG